VLFRSQAPRARRRAIADGVLHNDEHTSLDALAHHVRALWAAWIGPSGHPVEQ
jgi:hypothetical protein